MMKHDEGPHDALRSRSEAYFPGLRRTVRKPLTRLSGAFLRLALSVRFG